MIEDEIFDDFYDEDQEKLQETRNIARCLTFTSGELTLFMSAEYVTEIINGHTITPVPLLPSYVKGIINLRGQILPIVDIRTYMGVNDEEFTAKTCIVVVNIEGVTLGIIVDSVLQVEDIDLDLIKPVPVKRQKKLVNGMTHLADGTVAMSFDCEALAIQH